VLLDSGYGVDTALIVTLGSIPRQHYLHPLALNVLSTHTQRSMDRQCAHPACLAKCPMYREQDVSQIVRQEHSTMTLRARASLVDVEVIPRVDLSLGAASVLQENTVLQGKYHAKHVQLAKH
jgi:hypothetical protein